MSKKSYTKCTPTQSKLQKIQRIQFTQNMLFHVDLKVIDDYNGSLCEYFS